MDAKGVNCVDEQEDTAVCVVKYVSKKCCDAVQQHNKFMLELKFAIFVLVTHILHSRECNRARYCTSV